MLRTYGVWRLSSNDTEPEALGIIRAHSRADACKCMCRVDSTALISHNGGTVTLVAFTERRPPTDEQAKALLKAHGLNDDDDWNSDDYDSSIFDFGVAVEVEPESVSDAWIDELCETSPMSAPRAHLTPWRDA